MRTAALRGFHNISWSSSKVTRKDFYKGKTSRETGNECVKSRSGQILIQS